MPPMYPSTALARRHVSRSFSRFALSSTACSALISSGVLRSGPMACHFFVRSTISSRKRSPHDDPRDRARQESGSRAVRSCLIAQLSADSCDDGSVAQFVSFTPKPVDVLFQRIVSATIRTELAAQLMPAGFNDDELSATVLLANTKGAVVFVRW